MKTGLRRTGKTGRPDALATPNRETRLSAALIVFNHRLIAAIFTTAPLAMTGAAAMAATEVDPALSSPESGGSREPSVPTRHTQQYRDAFSAMMADPANAERSFEFARAAVSDDDIRGAIAALERILKINPGLANIRLQLGELYLRVGATDLAAAYLRQALLDPNIPPPLRQRAQSLLGQAERSKKKNFFTGSIYAGGRYDSNANAGPSSREVRVLGQQGQLDQAALGHSDWSGEIGATLNYTYALDSQAGDDIEANFTTYNRRYIDTHLLNLNSFGTDIGPRFYFGGVLDPSWSIRPFVSATYILLNSKSYLGQYGGGVNVRKILASASYVDLTVESSDQHFQDHEEFPTNSNRSGHYTELRSSVSYQLFPATRLFAAASVAQRNSDAGFESFKELGLGAGVTQVYSAPFHLTGYSWSTSLYVGAHRSVYSDADPSIDPSTKRQDNRLDVVLTNNVQISQTLTLTASVQYTNNNSTLPNFKYQDTSASLGLAWSF